MFSHYLRIVQFNQYLKEAITSVEIVEQSFGYTGSIFLAHENLCHILKKYTEIVIALFLDLEDGLLRLLI